jgi:hypothetical protein
MRSQSGEKKMPFRKFLRGIFIFRKKRFFKNWQI